MKTKAKNLLILISILFNVIFVNAETSVTTLKGKVVDENNQPVEYATAVLINPKTKEIIRADVSNVKGEFVINSIQMGDYVLSVSIFGFQKFETDRVMVDGKSCLIEKKIILREDLEEILTIDEVGNIQLVEKTVDKIVVNPESSI
jgi:hypothetical protein